MKEKSRLERWSEKKLKATGKTSNTKNVEGQESEESEATKMLDTIQEKEHPQITATTPPNELPIPEDLMDLDIKSLTADYDFSRFLKDDVPEFLRRKALRQLWRTNPILANLDGLNEYDLDYRDEAVGVAEMKGAFSAALAKLNQNHPPQNDLNKDPPPAGGVTTNSDHQPDHEMKVEGGTPEDTAHKTDHGEKKFADQESALTEKELIDRPEALTSTPATEAEPSPLALLFKHGWLQ